MNDGLDLEYDRLLGEGAYGKVFLVKQQDEQQVFFISHIQIDRVTYLLLFKFQGFNISGNRLFQSYSRLDPRLFRSNSLLVRLFRPGSFRPNFRGGLFRPNFGGSFQTTLLYIDVQVLKTFSC